MFELAKGDGPTVSERLASVGYWPAAAARWLAEGKYSRAVEECKEGLADEPGLVSGRVIYARALYHAGQVESAAEQFYEVLARDPENTVALKYLGDIKHAAGNHYAAVAHYRRVLEIDPGCRELSCPVKPAQKATPAEATRTITLKREAEPATSVTTDRGGLRKVAFYTETMGDLYLAQGHNRLAAEVYREVYAKNPAPRLKEKLERAEGKG